MECGDATAFVNCPILGTPPSESLPSEAPYVLTWGTVGGQFLCLATWPLRVFGPAVKAGELETALNAVDRVTLNHWLLCGLERAAWRTGWTTENIASVVFDGPVTALLDATVPPQQASISVWNQHHSEWMSALMNFASNLALGEHAGIATDILSSLANYFAREVRLASPLQELGVALGSYERELASIARLLDSSERVQKAVTRADAARARQPVYSNLAMFCNAITWLVAPFVFFFTDHPWLALAVILVGSLVTASARSAWRATQITELRDRYRAQYMSDPPGELDNATGRGWAAGAASGHPVAGALVGLAAWLGVKALVERNMTPAQIALNKQYGEVDNTWPGYVHWVLRGFWLVFWCVVAVSCGSENMPVDGNYDYDLQGHPNTDNIPFAASQPTEDVIQATVSAVTSTTHAPPPVRSPPPRATTAPAATREQCMRTCVTACNDDSACEMDCATKKCPK